MAKTVLITGSSRGIGLSTAKFYHKKGWNVVATMRDVNDWKFDWSNCLVSTLDVTDSKTIKKSLDKAVDTFGGVDVVVNNAGYGLFGPFNNYSLSQMKKQFDVNVFGVFDVTRIALPYLLESKGCFVNVSSVAGVGGMADFSVYCSSKFAVEGFTESLHCEFYKKGVGFKVVEPGPVKTDFFSEKSMDYAEDADNDDLPEFLMVSPVKVAKTIYNASVGRRSKFRYPVGFLMSFAVFVSKFGIFRFFLRK